MEKNDVDDIFKDFEHKVTDESETAESPAEEIDEHEILKRKYQKAEQALKERYNKETEVLQKKKGEKAGELPEHKKTPKKSSLNIERLAYIGIILVLVAYIIIDLSFYHGGKAVEASTDEAITAAAVKEENKTNETNEVEKETEEAIKEEVPVKEEENESVIEEKKELSGKITLMIDKINTEIARNINDTGYINSVVFTIENGKDKILTPVADVYAYDSELDKTWETKSRGQYKGIGIKPGDKYTGSLSLTPRTFSKLNLEKNVRLSLNDTKDGFIAAANEKVTIS